MPLVLWQEQKVRSPTQPWGAPSLHHLFKIKILPYSEERFALPRCSSRLLSQMEAEKEDDDMRAKPSFHSKETSPDSSSRVELRGRGLESEDHARSCPSSVLSFASWAWLFVFWKKVDLSRGASTLNCLWSIFAKQLNVNWAKQLDLISSLQEIQGMEGHIKWHSSESQPVRSFTGQMTLFLQQKNDKGRRDLKC